MDEEDQLRRRGDDCCCQRNLISGLLLYEPPPFYAPVWVLICLVLGLALILTSAGCANTYANVVRIATTADQQFVQTAKMYDQLYASRKITEQQYDTWKRFAAHYQIISEGAHRAITASDTSAADLLPVVQHLAAELALYEAYGLRMPAVKP